MGSETITASVCAVCGLLLYRGRECPVDHNEKGTTMHPSIDHAVEAAKDVINYVAKEDGPAYEFWRAHAIHLARYILSAPGPAVDAFDAEKWIFDLLVDIRWMDSEYPSDDEKSPDTFEADERAWSRWRKHKAAELTAAMAGRGDDGAEPNSPKCVHCDNGRVYAGQASYPCMSCSGTGIPTELAKQPNT